MMKRIGFVSTRIASNDGVSLEIKKWVDVLERNGFDCFFFAGELQTPKASSMLEPLAHFGHPEIQEVQIDCFGKTTRTRALSTRLQELKDRLKTKLYKFVKDFQLDLLIPQNALAIPMNIPLGLALTELIAEMGIPTIAHHHDFSWERDRFLVNAIEDCLQFAFPPRLPSIRHVVINSSASRQLNYRKGVNSVLIPNVLNFKDRPAKSLLRKKIRNKLGFSDQDLFILQPTRIVPRKWIERAVELVNLMELNHPRLVISHESGDEGDTYAQQIQQYANRMGVEILFVGDKINSSWSPAKISSSPYGLHDIYQSADLVTYPSVVEGFGNAFLEAIYYERPLVINRYPVYIEDIEPLGFEVISFDSFVTKDTVKKITDFLKPKTVKPALKKNFLLGKKNFSYEVLERKLLPLVHSFSD